MPGPRAPFLRFQEGYEIDAKTGCWLWTGDKCSNGYGRLKAFGRWLLAHRFSHELYKGPIPAGLHILHSCDVKACVNPDHIRLGTHAENMREARERGLIRAGPAHPMYNRHCPRPRQSNVVRVLGREFPSQKAAEREFGLGAGTVRYWLHNKPEKAQLIKTGELNVKRQQSNSHR